jgi:hypothetical protein
VLGTLLSMKHESKPAGKRLRGRRHLRIWDTHYSGARVADFYGNGTGINSISPQLYGIVDHLGAFGQRPGLQNTLS